MMDLRTIISFLKPVLFIQNFDDEVHELNIVFDSTFSSKSLGWISDKNCFKINDIKTGNVLISNLSYINYKNVLCNSVNWIVVENPRKAFADIIEHFFVEERKFGFIHPTAIISSNSVFNPNHVNVGPNVVIEDFVEIGDFIDIGANTVIKKGTIIKSNVSIGSNCTIGGVGFGYEKDNEGNYKVIKHIGNVILSDNVDRK